jgi:hypothetical protein
MSTAPTEAEVLAILRDYLHDWSPRELSALPHPSVWNKSHRNETLAFALEHLRTSNPTERFVVAKARERLAELEHGPL